MTFFYFAAFKHVIKPLRNAKERKCPWFTIKSHAVSCLGFEKKGGGEGLITFLSLPRPFSHQSCGYNNHPSQETGKGS